MRLVAAACFLFSFHNGAIVALSSRRKMEQRGDQTTHGQSLRKMHHQRGLQNGQMNGQMNGQIMNGQQMNGQMNNNGQQTGGQGRGFITCSDQIARISDRSVGQGDCMTWSRGTTHEYPTDFTILNRHTIYQCEDSGLRIIVSNGIPDHTVELRNPNPPCERNYMLQMPLNPVFSDQTLEPSASGIIAMSLNGVPAFGAQESGGTNAAEPLSDSTFTPVPYFGHASAGGIWHYHSGEFGRTSDLHTVDSDTLLGYALDGFPIYGPVENVEELDECGGQGDTRQTYRYHVRLFEQVDQELGYCNGNSPAVRWGYVVGCFKGDVSRSAILDSTLVPLPADCVVEKSSESSQINDSSDSATLNDANEQPEEDESATINDTSEQAEDESEAVNDSNDRPNFIVLQPDDFEFFQSWTPPPYIRIRRGQVPFPASGLPNIERLRQDGVQMMQAYTTSSMCGTSRYSTITGRYPSRSSYGRSENNAQNNSIANVVIPTTKLQDISNVMDGNDCSNNNVAALLQKNGYRTGVVGKWHLWQDGGDYTYAGTQNQVRSCGFDFAEALYKENLQGAWHDGTFSHNNEYITDKAIEFIEDSGDQPFFLYVNPTTPHSSGNVSEALTNFPCTATPEGTLPEEPSIRTMTEFRSCEEYRQTIFNRAQGRNDNRNLGSIYVDDGVGAILQALEDTNKLDNTFFLFQMDHGQEAKGTLYEPGIRIAQFVHFPRALGGIDHFDGLISTIDIVPTILDYAGIDESSPGYYEMDGQSWRSALEEPPSVRMTTSRNYFEQERCLFFELDYDRAVRCGCNKYVTLDSKTQDGTAVRGQRFNLAAGSDLLFNLCNENSSYERLWNMERREIINEEVLSDLQLLQQCHNERTQTAIQPQYTACGPVLATTNETNGTETVTIRHSFYVTNSAGMDESSSELIAQMSGPYHEYVTQILSDMNENAQEGQRLRRRLLQPKLDDSHPVERALMATLNEDSIRLSSLGACPRPFDVTLAPCQEIEGQYAVVVVNEDSVRMQAKYYNTTQSGIEDGSFAAIVSEMIPQSTLTIVLPPASSPPTQATESGTEEESPGLSFWVTIGMP